MISLRLATLDDFEFFYNLKCEPSNVYWTGHGEKPNRESLYTFFSKAVENAQKKDTRKIFIVENENDKVGHLYIIPANDGNSFELAPAISEKYCGRGYARQVIEQGLELGRRYGYKRLFTSIREDNIASIKAFASCGVKILTDYRMIYIPQLQKEVRMYFVEKELRDEND